MLTLKTAVVGRGVDLEREKRIKKCDAAIEKFVQFGRSKGFLKALKQKGEVLELASALENHLRIFMHKA